MDKDNAPASKFIQYIAVIEACIMPFCAGLLIGWSSPAEPQILGGIYGFNVTTYQSSWVGSLVPIGASITGVPAGYLTDFIGRKYTLLAIVPAFIVCFCLILWASSIEMLFAGRLISGMCAGAITVVAPVYVTEVCEKNIRGALGTYFQLTIQLGLMFVYVLGSLVDVFWLTRICLVFPILFGTTFIFFPETPVYLISKERYSEARKALCFLRGKHFNLDSEMIELIQGVKVNDKVEDRQQSKLDVFKSTAGRRSMCLAVSMMILQQLSGINTVIYYTVTILQNAGNPFSPFAATAIFGIIQLVASFLMTLVVDRFGRKILWIFSYIGMAISFFIFGLYYHLKTIGYDMSSMGWIPLTSICSYIIIFSFGGGPLPWLMMSELLPARIKGVGSSIGSVTMWLFAFLITKFFAQFVAMFGTDVTFWIFAGFNILGALFSYCLIETKGKSFEEIQLELGGKTRVVKESLPLNCTED